MSTKKAPSSKKNGNARDSERELSKPKAPRQLWVPIYDDRKDEFESYTTLKAAEKNAPENAVIVGPFVLAERNRQR
jgi:hypothetical protein